MAIIMEGKSVSANIKADVAKEIEKLKADVTLAVVLIGDDPASQVYVRNKEKACEKVGIRSETIRLSADTTQAEAEKVIKDLADDDKINGILVQLPLPKQLDKDALLELIPEHKDVDGLTRANAAHLYTNAFGIVPCTPPGVIDLLKAYGIGLAGKKAAIIGRSMLVGKPLSLLMLNENATVTVCHSKTKNIAEITKNSDIVVCALGKPKFLTADMVSDNCVVVDVGINRLETGLCGDADYEAILPKAYAITPVPGSCGPMTIAELLKNTLKCYKIQHRLMRE